MSVVDPSEIRAEAHAEIGNLLGTSVGIVVDRWARRAKAEQPNARRAHHAVLLDHFVEFLQKLAQSLVESDRDQIYQHCLPAAQHGEQRWENGWSLPEVIRDYQILRMTILEFLEESLDRPLRFREVLAVGLALDEAISASVVVYVKGREQHLAQIEEKRIGEVEAAQAQLRAQAQALKEADHRKNEFLAMLSHELRNPLAPVRHAVQVLRLKNSPDPDLQWAREVIERQAQQMARMIDDLFDVSRIAHGKVRLVKKSVSIAKIVERAVEEARPVMESRKHRFDVVLPPQPVWLEADGQRLTQVIVNLLVNAAKYTPEGGHVSLIGELSPDGLTIKVRDTGIGIPADLLPRIFEPFTQEVQSEDREQGGLGIGLALVRNLVELHGGRVHVSSAGRGHGSEFLIHLPVSCDLSQTPESPIQDIETLSATARRVLVVDDNHDSAQSLALLLKLLGNDVQTAHDGPTAIAMTRDHKPEIVLLDIGMPRMNGLEVARRIRQDLGFADVVLVAMTGYGHDEDRRKSREAGFNVHLVKPVELEHLRAILLGPASPSDGAGPM